MRKHISQAMKLPTLQKEAAQASHHAAVRENALQLVPSGRIRLQPERGHAEGSVIDGKLLPESPQDGAHIPVLNAICRWLRAKWARSNFLPKGSRKPQCLPQGLGGFVLGSQAC